MPTASTQPAAECRTIELRAPDGTSLDLTGTWSGLRSGLWFVTQSGSCVTMEGLSVVAGEPLGSLYRAVFFGHLGSDFSLVGTFIWTWYAPIPVPDAPAIGEAHPLTFHVGFGSGAAAVLEVPAGQTRIFGFQEPFELTLERIGTSTEFPIEK